MLGVLLTDRLALAETVTTDAGVHRSRPVESMAIAVDIVATGIAGSVVIVVTGDLR
jgi:hypothetical protein